MTDAANLTRELGGKWLRRYGSAPCPVCQPERRKGQSALPAPDGRDWCDLLAGKAVVA
ncbi:hypothetical protein SAMN05443432_102296 [Roseovarius litoreus]|uniref:Uncharacterized protein n=1 Tax=Roseovarius litoreus TaxID=1155722 RepID=A0A1M7CTI5_9RHOB|nr:hypothetical protein [Roseovarius litoreus]SHL70561.1 hypothetical protein SAMN05443432_102296 [Roseovarius litoreus]